MPPEAVVYSPRKSKARALIGESASSAPATLRDDHDESLYSRARRYLGGAKYWKSADPIETRSDVHRVIVKGVSFDSLTYLVKTLKGMGEDDIAMVLGISTRTIRRKREAPNIQKKMPIDLASKAWLLAETLAKGTEVFGGKDEAERWMSGPVSGLDGQRPIDLLQTAQGAEVVTDFLTRLEHGVYT